MSQLCLMEFPYIVRGKTYGRPEILGDHCSGFFHFSGADRKSISLGIISVKRSYILADFAVTSFPDIRENACDSIPDLLRSSGFLSSDN